MATGQTLTTEYCFLPARHLLHNIFLMLDFMEFISLNLRQRVLGHVNPYILAYKES